MALRIAHFSSVRHVLLPVGHTGEQELFCSVHPCCGARGGSHCPGSSVVHFDPYGDYCKSQFIYAKGYYPPNI